MPIPHGKPEQHQRVLLRDMVRERIRDAIMDGTLRPGEDLRDDELQAWLGVSRTPIRDAINELTRMGLIEMAPNRYTRVATPSEEEAMSAYNTLGVIFGGVVRLAVPHLGEGERRSVAKESERLQAAFSAEDLEGVSDRFMPFFGRYVERCGNPQLVQLCSDTIDGLAYKIRAERMRTIVDIDATVHDLTRLRAATLAGDPIAAELATESLFLLPGERPA